MWRTGGGALAGEKCFLQARTQGKAQTKRPLQDNHLLFKTLSCPSEVRTITADQFLK